MLKRASAVLLISLFWAGLSLLLTAEAWTEAVSDQVSAEPEQEYMLFSTSEVTPSQYLPLIFRNYREPRPRLGFCAVQRSVDDYPDISRLGAGWYVDFGVKRNPARPSGTEYVQTIRLHQLTECWPERTDDREGCPYVKPYTYTLTSPGTQAEIVAIAQAHPGSLWLIGNEMDRYDWDGGGQDEMLPEVYAVAYHDLYHLIKGADPTAEVAIGGVIQATPARLWYLDRVWDTYTEKYGQGMPVDVWNVHNFIFQERCDGHGASVPPGYPSCYGTLYADDDHDNLDIFKQQIYAFRQWMKEHGQQDKPLIVSEYGIVYWHVSRLNNWDAVKEFMLATFDFFANAKDCNVGYRQDGCRLVQRWAWYSLDDQRPYVYNAHSALFDPDTLQITPLGEAFAAWP